MKINFIDELQSTVMPVLIQRESQEGLAEGAITTEILAKLNINIEKLPQKCQDILLKAAESQTQLNMEQLDPIAFSLLQSKQLSEKLEEEYEVLLLKQKNAELQAKIDRNDKFLAELRRDLELSKEALAVQTPGPDNIQEQIRLMKQKVASYEESCEKAKMKYNKLSVPERVLPQSLISLAASAATLMEQAADLRTRADDVALARRARDTFNSLRR